MILIYPIFRSRERDPIRKGASSVDADEYRLLGGSKQYVSPTLCLIGILMGAEKLVLTDFVTRQDPHGVPIIPGQTANAKKKVRPRFHEILVVILFYFYLFIIIFSRVANTGTSRISTLGVSDLTILYQRGRDRVGRCVRGERKKNSTSAARLARSTLQTSRKDHRNVAGLRVQKKPLNEEPLQARKLQIGLRRGVLRA